jgi:hypothetical protein
MPSSTAPKTPQDRRQPKKTTRKRAAARPESPISQPIPQPEDPTSKYAPNTWLSGGVGGTEDLVVPSGQTCLVRRPGMEGLIKAGVLHNVDSLSQIVNEKHLKRVNGEGASPEIDMSSLMNDQEGLDEVMVVVDKVICHCVVKPEIHRTPNDVTRRQQGVVYTDMIDLLDKMHIFNFVVGGTRDLERFRGGLESLVGGVEAGEGVQ